MGKPRLPDVEKQEMLDLPMLLLTLLLTALGLVMIYSSSFARALYESGDSAYYFKRQGIFALVGTAAMLAISRVRPELIRKMAFPVLCVNDYLAIGAIRAITEAGLSVPEDISVCGFDDIDIAAYFNPPLTSIKTPCYEMGQMAANIMISAIESQTPLKVQYLLDTELIVRRTCGRVKEK